MSHLSSSTVIFWKILSSVPLHSGWPENSLNTLRPFGSSRCGAMTENGAVLFSDTIIYSPAPLATMLHSVFTRYQSLLKIVCLHLIPHVET